MAAKKRKQDWSGFGDYMNAKLRKLDQQFSVKDDERKKDIFKGVVIFINGYTIPPADELRSLVCQHGGRFQQYFSRSIVTHIIATNLPDSKITEIRDKKIVHPQWILESIKHCSLLPIEPYLLYNGRQAQQKQLSFISTSMTSVTSLEKVIQKDSLVHLKKTCDDNQYKNTDASLTQHSDVAMTEKLANQVCCSSSKALLNTNESGVLGKTTNDLLLGNKTTNGTNDLLLHVCEKTTNESNDLLLCDKITNESNDLLLGDKTTNESNDLLLGDKITNESNDLLLCDKITNESNDLLLGDKTTNESNDLLLGDKITNESNDLLLGDKTTNESNDLLLGDKITNESNDLLLGDKTTSESNDLLLGDKITNESNDLLLGDKTTNESNDLLLGDKTTNESNDLLLGDKTTNESNDLLLGDKTTNESNDLLLHVGDKTTNESNDLLLGDKTANETNDLSVGVTSANQRKYVHDKSTNQKPVKAGDTNFISEFYNNSRLHYLSTWGAELKQFTSELIKSQIKEGIVPSKHALPGYHGVPSKHALPGYHGIPSKHALPGYHGIPSKHALPGYYGRVIMHVDLDCFFVSVGLRDQPGLVGKPVAVCHAGKNSSANSTHTYFTSMSEVASCSYEARKAGVHNGMFLGAARKLCPHIVCIPYQFQQYREVSRQLYHILVGHTHDIEAVSCDEAYIDVSLILDEHTSPVDLAEQIRHEVKQQTDCTASIGIGHNMLLARLCTRVAKPNGQHWLHADDVQTFIGQQKVADLPGVGRALREKLQAIGVNTCAELQKVPLDSLQETLGDKTGATLYRHGHGEDDRSLRVEQERKSVSAEINYGIRFTKESEPGVFINELSSEVQRRLKEIGWKGQSVTLKLKVRREGAPEPRKYLGHGICDNIARSASLPVPTDDAKTIATKCQSLLRQLKLLASDIRGMGVQVSKLTQHKATMKTLHDFVGHPCRPQPASNSLHNTVQISTVTCQTQPADQPASNSLCAPSTTISPETKSTPSLPILPPLPKFFSSPQSTPKHRVGSQEAHTGDGTYEELVLPSPSRLDLSALNALPSDIRLDIERQYAKQNNKVVITTTNQDPDSIHEKSTARPHDQHPNLVGAVSCAEVKTILKQWIATSAPYQEDIDVGVNYFVQLIECKNIEQLWILIKFFVRCIAKTREQAWSSACQQIVNRVQQSVIDNYGAPLALTIQ